jgi:4-amino-4-deoxy-L-arabinose transferase-like glycosyltransferase
MRGGETIRIYGFPLIPIVIIAALAFLGDRAMEYWTLQKQGTLAVIIVALLTLLVLVLMIFLNCRRKNRKGGA